MRCIAHQVPMSKRCSEGMLCLTIKLREGKVKEMVRPRDKAGKSFVFSCIGDPESAQEGKQCSGEHP